MLNPYLEQPIIMKSENMWHYWLGRRDNNLSKSHLYNLKYPYISMYI